MCAFKRTAGVAGKQNLPVVQLPKHFTPGAASDLVATQSGGGGQRPWMRFAAWAHPDREARLARDPGELEGGHGAEHLLHRRAADLGVQEQGAPERARGEPARVADDDVDQVAGQLRVASEARHFGGRDARVAQQDLPDGLAVDALERHALGVVALARGAQLLGRVVVADARVHVVRRRRTPVVGLRRGDEGRQRRVARRVAVADLQADPGSRSRVSHPDRLARELVDVAALGVDQGHDAALPLGDARGAGHEDASVLEVRRELALERFAVLEGQGQAGRRLGHRLSPRRRCARSASPCRAARRPGGRAAPDRSCRPASPRPRPRR